jgi:hypothetical protein
VEQILEQEEAVEEKHTDSLVDAVAEFQNSTENQKKRNQKIKQKFNRSDDDLTIKY